MSEDVKLDTRALDEIIKLWKADSMVARVGVLGEHNARRSKKGTSSNAEIGAAHEFGAPKKKLPQRSFLRVPLIDNLGKELESAGAFTEDTLKEVVKQGSMLEWVKTLAVIAEGIVLGAFDTAGYGKWPELKKKTMDRKKTKQILVETQQLRNSITSEVV